MILGEWSAIRKLEDSFVNFRLPRYPLAIVCKGLSIPKGDLDNPTSKADLALYCAFRGAWTVSLQPHPAGVRT
jgi:hypothetical protein